MKWGFGTWALVITLEAPHVLTPARLERGWVQVQPAVHGASCVSGLTWPQSRAVLERVDMAGQRQRRGMYPAPPGPGFRENHFIETDGMQRLRNCRWLGKQ